MKANFFERFSAYLIDIIIVTAISSLIISFMPIGGLDEISNMMRNLLEKFLSGEITPEKYFSSISALQYEYDIKTITYSIFAVFINMMYFIYYQFNKKGQTIGKKILKIKVVKKDGKLELNDFVKRSLIINFIFFDLMILFILMLSSEEVYFSFKYVFSLFQLGIITLSALFIMFRKDKISLHDFLTKTRVEREEGQD